MTREKFPRDAEGCQSGKRCFPTEREAWLALFVLALKHSGYPRPHRCYSCRKCGCWHLTAQELTDSQPAV